MVLPGGRSEPSKGGYGHKNYTYSVIHVFIVFCDPENIGIGTILDVVSAIVFVLWRFFVISGNRGNNSAPWWLK